MNRPTTTRGTGPGEGADTHRLARNVPQIETVVLGKKIPLRRARDTIFVMETGQNRRSGDTTSVRKPMTG